jgi:hypothetical protein
VCFLPDSGGKLQPKHEEQATEVRVFTEDFSASGMKITNTNYSNYLYGNARYSKKAIPGMKVPAAVRSEKMTLLASGHRATI